MKTVRRALPYAAVALAASAVLFFSLRLGEGDLRVPFVYAGDGLFYAVVAKAVSEDGFSRFARLGAPFGMGLFDWPTGMLLDFSVLGLLTRLLGSAGLALNLYWLASVVLTSVLAAWSLRRLELEPALAFPLGLLYGLLPYAFYRNVAHISLVYHFVPLLALLLVRVAEGLPERAGRTERWTTRAACVLQGLSYPYYGFFASALLVVAGALGSLRARSSAPARSAGLAVALVAASTAACLAPTVLYRRAHGGNPELEYKAVAETDAYGLKIRQLVTPIPDHPLAAMRWAASQIAGSGFPLENENATTKMGAVASLGFLLLLFVSVASGAGRLRDAPERLHAVAGLNLGAVLLATIGGLGSLFAVFVSAQVRAWNRIAVFNAFFGLLACGLVLGGGLATARAAGRAWARFLPATVAALLCLAVLDQVSPWPLVASMGNHARQYAGDREFVRRIEQLLPPGSRVFQLPHTPTPLDRSALPMLPYDHARAYLHSRTLAWSWGAIAGRNGNWAWEVQRLSPPALVRTLVLAGFSGVWIDRFGYEKPAGRDRASTPRPSSPEAAIVRSAGGRPETSSDGRYVFVSIETAHRQLASALGSEGWARERELALRPPLVPRYREGFGEEETDGVRVWRPGRPRGRIVVMNYVDREREALLSARFSSPGREPQVIEVSSPQFTDTLAATREGVDYRRTVFLPARRRVQIHFSCPDRPATGMEPCFHLVDLQVVDVGRPPSTGNRLQDSGDEED